MNDPHPEPSENIADANVERLIREGYRPETLDAQFVVRVQEQMLAAATERRDAQRPATASSSSQEAVVATPPGGWMLSAGWGVAILLLIGIIAMSNFRRPAPRQSFQTQGDVVWIDGKAYVAESAQLAPLPGTDLRPLDEMLVGFNPSGRKYDVSLGLVAREKPEAAKSQAAKIGDSIVTGANEQRRLTLPDGSVLFIDENTQAKLVADRQVEVTKGEIFVEVSPRILPDETRGTFLVNTAQRSVTALGTKFGVRTGESPRVLVTQGKVEVSGVEQPLAAGQQFIVTDGIPVIEAAPRADVAFGWMRELVVAAEGALVPENEKAGGDLIAVDPDGQDVKLSLRKYHVDVHIEDGFARTTIDQTYFNHMWSRLEGTFYFPLPPDASLSRLAMYVGPKLMEGGMAERDYARQVFESIKTRQLDPALLEWVDGSTFKMRVFPLEGRQEKRIILSYTQKLDISYGRTRYRFPAGHNMKLVDDWSVKLRVKDGRGLLWDSPSHTLDAKKEGRDLVLTAEEKLSRLDKDVVLFLNDDSIARSDVGRIVNPSRADYQSALLSTTVHEDAHYLMLRWRPDLPTEKTRQRRDWVFLFESSADRDPLLARTQIEIIRTVLNHAEHDDTFAIVTAGAYASAYEAKPQAATPENIAQAIEYLNKTHLVGGLDLQQAFRSLETFTKDAANPVIVHVGSGTPILGDREQDQLTQALPANAQYVGVGVGKRFNRNLMKQAAARSGGYFTQINPDESISWRGFELVSALNTPRLLDIKIATDSGACQMLSLADSLADGEELCALGRYEKPGDAPSELTITWQLYGQPFTQTVPVTNVQKSTGPLPRMWAKQQIELLSSLGAEQHKDQIIKLSKAMYVMSPFTSLLVLENDEMYEQYKIDRGRKDHWALYPAPDVIEVVEERDEGRGARGEEKEEGEGEGEEKSEEGDDEDGLADDGTSSKPSAAEVLGTILVHRPASALYWPNRGYNESQTTTVLQAMNIGYGIPFATPMYSFSTVTTTVTVPDEGTILIGGVRRMQGVPMLTKMPYVNRLFRSHGSIDDPLMMMVTPRILIQEEDETLLRFSRFGVNGTAPILLLDDSQSMVLRDPFGSDEITFGTNGVARGWTGRAWRGEWNGDFGLFTESFGFHDRRVRDIAWGVGVNSDAGVSGQIVFDVPDWTIDGTLPYNDLDQVRQPSGSQFLEVYNPRGKGAAEADFDSLIDLITATVRPDTWDNVGGPGTVEPFPGNLSLVISQTQTVYDQPHWAPMSYSPDGRWPASEADRNVRLWDNGDADGGWYYSPPGGFNRGYENSVDWFVRSRLGGRSAELASLQAQLSAERSGRAFALAGLQESRQLESDLRRLSRLELPDRYRDIVSDYYRVLSEDELDWKVSDDFTMGPVNGHRPLLRHLYFDIAGDLPTQHEVRELLGTDFLGGTDVALRLRGPEFKLTREAEAMRTFVDTPPGDVRPSRRPPWEIEPTADTLNRVDELIAEIRDPEIVITVDPRKTRIVNLKRPVSKWSVTNPNVVNVTRGSFNDLQLHGKAQGITTLTLWYESDSDEPEVLRYLVRVAMDDDEVDELTNQLKEFVVQARSRRDGIRQTLAGYVLGRSEGRISQPDVFYQRPQFTGSNEVFSRLVSYAPGLNTQAADVYAVLEAEANVALPLRGSVDAGAKRLIDRARSLGWQRITHPAKEDRPAFTVIVNGQGQYRYEHRTHFGLRETVICDGESLTHHYDEIGLGATRQVSRFHRQQTTSLAPWAALPASDLAIGADVRLVDGNTIAIVPMYAELGLPYIETQLIFDAVGRLAQRRLVARPDNDIVLSVNYFDDGAITWFDGEGDAVHYDKVAVESADAPNLTPDDSELVVLPMPARTRDHVYQTSEWGEGGSFAKLSKANALRLLAADMHTYNNEVLQIVGQRFFAKGDRRLGFYTLMLNAGNHWDPSEPLDVGDDQKVKVDPLQDDAKSPLAQYIASQLQYLKVGHAEEPATIEWPKVGFLQELAEFRRQFVRWTTDSSSDPFAGPSEGSGKEFGTLLEVAERTHAPEFRWAMLNLLSTSQADLNDGLRKRYAATYERLTDDPAVGYFARYEHAKALYRSEQYDQSRKVFTKWYEDTLAAGRLPRVDNDFRNAMYHDGGEPYRKLLMKACNDFVKQGRRPTAMTLAWQTYKLGDSDLANELAAVALADLPKADRFAVTLSGVEYFAASGQQRRALVLLETLLSDEDTEELSMLWRLGSSLASQQQMIARSAKMLEQALALEYGALKPDDVVNLEQLRNDYGELLNRYEQLATALATLEAEPSPALLSRLISVADRWRSMEDDVGLPCNRVAPIFTSLGANELAWQYITTPLAARPNEAAPWLDLASNMRAEDNFAMADRAYREAFKSEGTNAQILWDHAGMLKELGRHEEARRLYEQIANTTWQPRFQHFKSQAEEALRN